MAVAEKWLMRDTTEKWTGRDRGARDRGLAERLSLEQGVVFAVTSAAGLTTIDVVYVMKGRIPQVYLLADVAELTIIDG
jgi:hypothetical protein